MPIHLRYFFYELCLISNKYLISWESNWPKVVIICERLGEEMFTSGLSSVLTARAVGSSPPHDSAQSNDDICNMIRFTIIKREKSTGKKLERSIF